MEIICSQIQANDFSVVNSIITQAWLCAHHIQFKDIAGSNRKVTLKHAHSCTYTLVTEVMVFWVFFIKIALYATLYTIAR